MSTESQEKESELMFNGLANVIIKHPKAIVAIWLAVLLASVGVILTQESNLKYDMTQMEGGGSESIDGMLIMENEDIFYQDVTQSMGTIIVIDGGTATERTAFLTDLQANLDPAYAVMTVMNIPIPGIELSMCSISYLDTELKTADQIPIIRGLVEDTKATAPGSYVTYVTGTDGINYDTEAGAMEDMKKIDPFSILLILVLIGLFFRSFVTAATPPLAVGAAYGIMTCVILFLSGVIDIFYISPIIMLVSMLGAGCDYCIFMLARYREERKLGLVKEDALRETIKWAGESITTSGLSVIIGFGVMSFCTFSMISTMGMVLAMGIVIALLAALTLVPSVLMLVGDKIFKPSTIETYSEGSKAMNGWYGNWSRRGARYFEGSAKHAIKYAKPIVIAAVLITVPMAYIMATEESSYDMIATMPPGEAKDGMDIVVDTLGGGTLMPTYVITEFNTPLATVDTSTSTITWNLTAAEIAVLAEIELVMMSLDNVKAADSIGVYLAMSPIMEKCFDGTLLIDVPAIYADLLSNPLVSQLVTDGKITTTEVMFLASIIESRAQGIVDATGLTPGAGTVIALMGAYNYAAYPMGLISEDGMYTKTTVIMEDEPMSNLSMRTIDTIREYMSEIKTANSGLIVATWVTGTTAVTYDISEMVNAEFMWIELGVIILIFLLLFFVLKSYLTPLRAILTILMSIAWTVGLTHIVFGMILGIPVMWIIPIVLLVICLGLGMDYDILLTTRIREGVLKGMTNDEAITNAIQKSGAVITICGLIMSGTFFTLTLSSSPMLQEFGFALGFAILVDALVVRTYIVPAVMHLLGDWNWKGPKFLQKKELAKKEAEEGSEE
jgi:Predicted drug exporters of the RND superfamily